MSHFLIFYYLNFRKNENLNSKIFKKIQKKSKISLVPMIKYRTFKQRSVIPASDLNSSVVKVSTDKGFSKGVFAFKFQKLSRTRENTLKASLNCALQTPPVWIFTPQLCLDSWCWNNSANVKNVREKGVRSCTLTQLRLRFVLLLQLPLFIRAKTNHWSDANCLSFHQLKKQSLTRCSPSPARIFVG